MKTNQLIITVVVVIIVAAAAFYGGMSYQKTQATRSGQNQLYGQAGTGGRFGGPMARFGGNRAGGGAVIGQIVNMGANSITVKLKNGSSKIINLTASTKVMKTSTASSSDLTNGIRVAVFGTTNGDGSINAQNVQINPGAFQLRGAPSPAQTQ